DKIKQECKQARRCQDQEQYVTAQVARLDAAQPAAYPVEQVRCQVCQPIYNSQVEDAVPVRQLDGKAGNGMHGPINKAQVEGPESLGHHQGWPYEDGAVQLVEIPLVSQEPV